jgi:serine phosphatase RsbU (regulator of sigma subunit)
LADWSLDNDRVLILDRPNAEAVALRYGLFACPDEHLFWASRYLAFYKAGLIEQVFEITAPPRPGYQLETLPELEYLFEAEALPVASTYTVFPLRWLGRVGPIRNDLTDARGYRIHFSYGEPHYTNWATLVCAEHTSELTSWQPAAPEPVPTAYIERLAEQELPVPAGEPERLQELYSYGILDTSPEEEFDNLTRAAAQICGTSMAIITLIDAERQWFKSTYNFASAETARSISFCQYTITQSSRYLEIPDAREDERFCKNPLVLASPHIRFYAGAALENTRGYRLGTLCVLDSVPHVLDDNQRTCLHALAREIMQRLELRQAHKQLEHQHEELKARHEQLQATQRELHEAHLTMTQELEQLQRLQTSLLPDEPTLRARLGEAMLSYRFREAVSGDFFWHGRQGPRHYLVLGEGSHESLSGAFVTQAAIGLLDRLTQERQIVNPAQLLATLHRELAPLLTGTLPELAVPDLLDLAILVYQPAKRRLEYVTHMRPVYLLREGELYRLGRQHAPAAGPEPQAYYSKVVELQPGDRVYVVTSGLTRQPGGEELGIFSENRLREHLLSTQTRPLQEQKASLLEAFDAWRGNLSQSRDVILAGFEV